MTLMSTITHWQWWGVGGSVLAGNFRASVVAHWQGNGVLTVLVPVQPPPLLPMPQRCLALTLATATAVAAAAATVTTNATATPTNLATSTATDFAAALPRPPTLHPPQERRLTSESVR